jgi:hypothetical protein
MNKQLQCRRKKQKIEEEILILLLHKLRFLLRIFKDQSEEKWFFIKLKMKLSQKISGT